MPTLRPARPSDDAPLDIRAWVCDIDSVFLQAIASFFLFTGRQSHHNFFSLELAKVYYARFHREISHAMGIWFSLSD